MSASSFGPASSVAIAVEARTGSFTARAAIHDWATDNPLNDHPDDSQSVADRRYPTPWIVDPAAPIGLLLGGWGQGLGHMLGRYGIATAPVTRELSPLGADFTDLSHLKALFIGSGGLSGLDRSPSLRAKLANFVAEGGVLVALTPQRGTELEALPGGEVAGFGWSEDQACFDMAAQIVSRKPRTRKGEPVRFNRIDYTCPVFKIRLSISLL